MRTVGAAALLAVLAGCTSVTLAQRDGCWVRQTKKPFGRVNEELGPCAPPRPTWSQDRLTRLVQECTAEADSRWWERARQAWVRGVPAPNQPPEQEILRTCMQEARVGLAAEADGLRTGLATATGERDDLRRQLAEDHAALRASHEQIARFLGEAAQKPAGTATATATATGTGDGKSTNDSGATLAAEARAPAEAPATITASAPASAPAATPVAAPVIPAAPPSAGAGEPRSRRAKAGRARRALVETAARGCPIPEPVRTPEQATPPSPSR
jgi:hypothetical protein